MVFATPEQAGSDRAILYMHGLCGEALAFRTWSSAVAPWGTLVALQGDIPCDVPYRFSWNYDARSLQARIERALDGVARARGRAVSHNDLTIIGYSQGALRAEALAKRFSSQYTRVILISGPRPPHLDGFSKHQRIVLMSGAIEDSRELRRAADLLRAKGLAANFFVLPNAGHGDYGPDAEQAMSKTLEWVFGAAP